MGNSPAPLPLLLSTQKKKHILLENKLHRLIRSLAHTSFLKTKYDLQNVLGNRNQRAWSWRPVVPPVGTRRRIVKKKGVRVFDKQPREAYSVAHSWTLHHETREDGRRRVWGTEACWCALSFPEALQILMDVQHRSALCTTLFRPCWGMRTTLNSDSPWTVHLCCVFFGVESFFFLASVTQRFFSLDSQTLECKASACYYSRSWAVWMLFQHLLLEGRKQFWLWRSDMINPRKLR